jgi:large subunit ribosomal protein L15
MSTEEITKEAQALSLSTLSPGKANMKTAKRIGRGNGSGWGRTAGKGEKGQKARSGGKIPAWFQGGSLPFYRKIPKVGFRSRKQILGTNSYALINISDLNDFNDGDTVDLEVLKKKGISSSTRNRAGVKLLGNGTLEKKLTIKVNAASASAIKAVEEKGGSIELVS